MICNKCGSQIPDNAVECEFCGAKVDASAVNGDTKSLNSREIAAASAGGANVFDGNEKNIFNENEKKRSKQMEKMMEDKKKQLSEIEKRRNEKRKKQKRKKIAVIALICAAAAGAAGVGAHYIIQGTMQNTKTTEQTLPVSSPVPVPSTAPSVTPTPVPSANPSASPASYASQSQKPASAQSGQGSSTPSWTGASSGGSSASSSARSSDGSSSAASSGKSSGGSSSGSGSSSGGTSGSGSSTGTSSASSGQSSQQNAQSFADIYAKASDSGIVSNKISSRLVTGGEVIKDSAAGRLLMTFIMDGARYYAHVSEGSTTDQIKGKAFTINADATSETYNGNTVYEISNITGYDGDYILPESGTRLLTENDIKGLSKYDLALARNEIYARHGRKFQTAEYSTYFSSKPWYHINPNYNYSDDDGNLNEIERNNVMLILEAEK